MSIMGLMSDDGLGFIQSPTLKVAPKLPDYTPLMKVQEFKESLKAKLADDNAKTDPKISNAVAKLSENMKGLTKDQSVNLTKAITELNDGWSTLLKDSGGNASLAVQKPEYQQLMVKAASYGDVNNQMANEQANWNIYKSNVDKENAYSQINIDDLANPEKENVDVKGSGLNIVHTHGDQLTYADKKTTFMDNPNRELKYSPVVDEGKATSLTVALAQAAASNSTRTEDYKLAQEMWAKYVGTALPAGFQSTLFQTGSEHSDNKQQLTALVENIKSYYTEPMMNALKSNWLKNRGYVKNDSEVGWYMNTADRKDMFVNNSKELSPAAQQDFDTYIANLVGLQVEPFYFTKSGESSSGNFQTKDGGGSDPDNKYGLYGTTVLGINQTNSETKTLVVGPDQVKIQAQVATSPTNLAEHSSNSLYNPVPSNGFFGGTNADMMSSKNADQTFVVGWGNRITYLPALIFKNQGGTQMDPSVSDKNAVKKLVPYRMATVATTDSNMKDILKSLRVQDTVWETEEKPELLRLAGDYLTANKEATWGSLHKYLIDQAPEVMKKLSSNNITLDQYSKQNENQSVSYKSQPKSITDQSWWLDRANEKLTKIDFNDLIKGVRLTGTMDEETINKIFKGSKFGAFDDDAVLNTKDAFSKKIIDQFNIRVYDSWEDVQRFAQLPDNEDYEANARFHKFMNPEDGWIISNTTGTFHDADRIILFDYLADITQQLNDAGSSKTGLTHNVSELQTLNQK